jgi:pyruvate/2-oxoglutarate/acetoin dehydrogenase E1 component
MTDRQPRTVLDSLNQALHTVMDSDPSVVLLGEDLLDPYGGAFKVARGLSDTFPEQVIPTPISEAGITGIAGGMALRGLRPVVEIMFGDFTTLTADQLINHLSKFNLMYAGEVHCPVVIRAPMGGRRGYGPTHSQTLEKHFLGVPGLAVWAPFHLQGNHPLGAPGKLLQDAIVDQDSPVLFIENKLQYLLKLLSPQDLVEFEIQTIEGPSQPACPQYLIAIKSAPQPQITLAAYGYMAHLAMGAVHRLAYEHEIFCHLWIPTGLSPFDFSGLIPSLSQSSRLLTVEEGSRSLGWGAEVLARAAEALGQGLKGSNRLAAQDTVVPASPALESRCLPGEEEIITHVREMVATHG